MKNLFLLIVSLFCVTLITSCKKSDTPASPPSVPAISGFSSRIIGTGYQLTINGSNFSQTIIDNIVTINGTPSQVVSASPTQLKVIVSGTSGSGKIGVTVGGKTATSTDNIQIISLYVTTLAGDGTAGSTDGPGLSANFNGIWGVVCDGNGSLYIADTYSNKIRKISTDGTVSTFAGTGAQGNNDGAGISATFSLPFGIAIDKDGNLYVSDFGTNNIRKITPAGIVSTLAGSIYGTTGSDDGAGTAATFNHPVGVATDVNSNIYVADAGNNKIRKITPGGTVTTLAGSGASGAADATGVLASFNQPLSIVTDANANLYVSEEGNYKIRKITPSSDVTTFAGSGISGSADGTAKTASFNFPVGMVIDPAGDLIVTDNNNGTIRLITQAGITATLAGNGNKTSIDGIGYGASLDNPLGITMDKNGVMYVLDNASNKVRKVILQ